MFLKNNTIFFNTLKWIYDKIAQREFYLFVIKNVIFFIQNFGTLSMMDTAATLNIAFTFIKSLISWILSVTLFVFITKVD